MAGLEHKKIDRPLTNGDPRGRVSGAIGPYTGASFGVVKRDDGNEYFETVPSDRTGRAPGCLGKDDGDRYWDKCDLW